MAVLIALMTGMILGMRFKFLVLVPGMIVAAFVLAALGVAHGDSVGTVAIAIIKVSISLQVGYLLGLAGKRGAVIMRAARMRKAAPRTRSAVSRHAH